MKLIINNICKKIYVQDCIYLFHKKWQARGQKQNNTNTYKVSEIGKGLFAVKANLSDLAATDGQLCVTKSTIALQGICETDLSWRKILVQKHTYSL